MEGVPAQGKGVEVDDLPGPFQPVVLILRSAAVAGESRSRA